MFKVRCQPLTIYPNHKIRVLLIIVLIYVLHRRYSIFSSYMILIRQLSKTSGIVTSILFYYTVHLSIFYLTLKVSKSYYVI